MVELIIYIFILSILLVSITYFAIDMIGAQQKSRSYQEVQYNARFAMMRVIREIRTADNLNAGASTFDASPGVLSLAHDDGAKDPTVFDISGERMRINQGGTGPYYLTNDRVRITNLVFENLSVANRTKTIKITLTAEHVNPENRNEYDASVTLESTAVIRERSDVN